MKGFQNIGNTCYMNAGLQMLVQNKDLCTLISKYHTNSPILNTINMFIQEYYDTNSTNNIIPSSIKELVESKQEIFMGFQQQDSIEFVICLLDIIDMEIKKENKVSKELEAIFGVEINTRTKCKIRDCLNISNIKDTNNFLLLDMEPTFKSLDDIYRNFKSGEMLEDDNMYYCDKCKMKRNASKRYSVEKWAPSVLIWLKRFKATKNSMMKIGQALDIPLVWRNKQLKGAIIHYGNLNGGHYVYVGKHNDMWYLFDDSRVTEVDNINSLLSYAYCLNYEYNP